MLSFLLAISLIVSEEPLVVKEQQTTVLSVRQPDGTWGYKSKEGDIFDVHVVNQLKVPTSIHWHGLLLPNDQDGVAFITQFPIYPGQTYPYRFPLKQCGTYWMHAHYGMQEQRLLAAPLILTSAEDHKMADQEVVMLLSDFSFQSPESIFQSLKCRKMEMEKTDLVDIQYDAFLTNLKTLDSPEIISVEAEKTVRLRIINGASNTNFLISTPLKGVVIAVDGHLVKPISMDNYPLAASQRIDLLVKIPKDGGSFPVLAQAEGTNQQTGLLLSTKNSNPTLPSTTADQTIGALTYALEAKLQAMQPLPLKPIDQKLTLVLGGNMSNYTWTLNGQSWPEVTPLLVEKGQRVELTFKNESSMSHPMHLHGHVFQVTHINEQPINGAIRDTILVTPNSTVIVQFDADNPGVWPLHCHLLYHQEAGMFTVLRYKE